MSPVYILITLQLFVPGPVLRDTWTCPEWKISSFIRTVSLLGRFWSSYIVFGLMFSLLLEFKQNGVFEKCIFFSCPVLLVVFPGQFVRLTAVILTWNLLFHLASMVSLDSHGVLSLTLHLPITAFLSTVYLPDSKGSWLPFNFSLNFYSLRLFVWTKMIGLISVSESF